MLPEELFPIVQKAMAEGYQLTPDAFQLLQETPVEEAIQMMEKAIIRAYGQSDLFIIDAEFIKTDSPVKKKPTPLASKSRNVLDR